MKKYRIFEGSEFSAKRNANSRCLLFPTTWIFEQQFARNENWLRIFERKFPLLDKWLRSLEWIFAPYFLFSNIPTHLLDDNLPTSNFLQWFLPLLFRNVWALQQTLAIYITIIIYSVRLTWIYFKGSFYCLVHIKSISALYTIILWSFLGSTKATRRHTPCFRNPDSVCTFFLYQWLHLQSFL